MSARQKEPPNRKAEIVAAGRALIAREGAGALSLRAVAERVGVKLASLQYHVPTKAALIDLILEDAVDRYRRALARFSDEAGDGATRLRRAALWLAAPAPEWTEIAQFEIQLWAFAAVDPAARAALDRYLALYREFLGGLVAAANPSLTRAEAERRAIAVASLLEGSMLFLPPGGGAPRRALAAELADAAAAIALRKGGGPSPRG